MFSGLFDFLGYGGYGGFGGFGDPLYGMILSIVFAVLDLVFYFL
jgi:hypothetical protein